VKKIAYGVGIEGCFTQNGAAVAFQSKDGDVDVKASRNASIERPSITASHRVRHHQPQSHREGDPDIEIRSGAIVTAGGLVFTRCRTAG